MCQMYKLVLVVLAVLLPIISSCEPTEFLVNTYTKDEQAYPVSAMDNVGNFIIVWCGNNSSDSFGVFAQRYDNNGNSLGGEFQINTYMDNQQRWPSIAMAPNGNFVVTWYSIGQDGSVYGIYAQRLDSNGNKVGNEFQVNTYTDGLQWIPTVAMDDNENFVIAWQSQNQDGSGYGIFAQRYNNSGNPIGNEFQVNTYTNNNQLYPTSAMDSDGDFVIAWRSEEQVGEFSIFAQRYDNAGNPIGGEFRANTNTSGWQHNPSVVMDSIGNFIIVWQSAYQDGSGWGVYAQRYNNNGNPLGGEFQVNTYTNGSQQYPSIAMDDNGKFIITWGSEQDGYGYGIFAQKFDSNGNKVGNEFQVNTYTDYDQILPTVAINNDENFIIAWESPDQPNQDNWDIYAKHYPQTPPNAIDLEWFTAEPGFGCVILGWQTGTEIDNLGFYLVKTDNFLDFSLLNGSIIPAQGNAYSGSEYLYVDDKVMPGRVYHYWLVDVDVYGKYIIHGPTKVITYIEERQDNERK